MKIFLYSLFIRFVLTDSLFYKCFKYIDPFIIIYSLIFSCKSYRLSIESFPKLKSILARKTGGIAERGVMFWWWNAEVIAIFVQTFLYWMHQTIAMMTSWMIFMIWKPFKTVGCSIKIFKIMSTYCRWIDIYRRRLNVFAQCNVLEVKHGNECELMHCKYQVIQLTNVIKTSYYQSYLFEILTHSLLCIIIINIPVHAVKPT